MIIIDHQSLIRFISVIKEMKKQAAAAAWTAQSEEEKDKEMEKYSALCYVELTMNNSLMELFGEPPEDIT